MSVFLELLCCFEIPICPYQECCFTFVHPSYLQLQVSPRVIPLCLHVQTSVKGMCYLGSYSQQIPLLCLMTKLLFSCNKIFSISSATKFETSFNMLFILTDHNWFLCLFASCFLFVSFFSIYSSLPFHSIRHKFILALISCFFTVCVKSLGQSQLNMQIKI